MVLYTDKYDSRKQIVEKNTYIRVDGGDGTLLTAIHKYQNKGKPFYGVAMGTRNFLMNECAVKSPTAVKYSFHTLVVHVLDSDGVMHHATAFNDVVIGEFNAWIEFTCSDSENQLGIFKGSGMIVSTAQGSTGINRNNHGTILPLTSPNWSVTGMQTDRTINSIVSPEELVINCTTRGNVTIAIDGTHKVIHNVDSITIQQGPTVDVLFNRIGEFQRKRQ